VGSCSCLVASMNSWQIGSNRWEGLVQSGVLLYLELFEAEAVRHLHRGLNRAATNARCP
jgi:hypothetical protein